VQQHTFPWLHDGDISTNRIAIFGVLLHTLRGGVCRGTDGQTHRHTQMQYPESMKATMLTRAKFKAIKELNAAIEIDASARRILFGYRSCF